MKNIDLHIHTSFSDGLLSPAEVLALATERKLDVISITDHDTLDGYRAAAEFSGDFPCELIPGVEISTNYQGADIHILAYDFNPQDKKLNSLLQTIQKGRFVRAQKIIQKLSFLGIGIDFRRVRKLAGNNDLIGRPHIAQALVEAGYCRDKQEAFDNLINNEGPAYCPKPTPSPKKIIKTVKKAGGIAVVAHPYTIKNDDLLREIILMGLSGLEVYYAKANAETVNHYERIALEYNLIRTGGSDFHGDELDWELFGRVPVPELVLEEIRQRLNCQMPAVSNQEKIWVME